MITMAVSPLKSEAKERTFLSKEEPEVLKTSEVYTGGHIPYRYVIRQLPYGKDCFLACRENMELIGQEWVTTIRYWCAYCETLEAAEKEYTKRLDTEPKH